MVIEHKWSLWKGFSSNQSRIRLIHEKDLVQSHKRCQDLRQQITIVENQLTELIHRITSIDFAQIHQKLHACLLLRRTEAKRTRIECRRIRNQLIALRPKLILGHAYLRARSNWKEIPLISSSIIKKNRRLKIEHRWRKGITDIYRKLRDQRDRHDLLKDSESVERISSLIQEEIATPIDAVFVPPLPPLASLPIKVSDEVIIPFETPLPIMYVDDLEKKSSRTSPSDRSPLTVDDTIVKPHRLINKTLTNLTQMSFHIDPELCSSPKPNEKKKKMKLIQFIPPEPAAAPPQFSSTAIFDSHAFFTQTTHKTKKQKKKIDISRQPMILSNCDTEKKINRRKKQSPYDFQETESIASSTMKGSKLLSDDIITARFAKNSHYQSHQTSMASTKSSRSQRRHNENQEKRKKNKINILGIGQSSPLTLSNTMNLSPGRLSTDDKDDDSQIQSTLSKRQHRRTRAK